jgi:hypothetical protein
MNGDVAYRTHDVGIGTATPLSKLTVSSGDWDDHLTISRLANDSGHISIGSNNMVLWTGSGSGLYVANSGNVGVGVASPSTKLAVNGTAQVAGFQMPTGASAGYVLTSDVSGVGTWQAASGGIGGGGTADYVPRFTGASTLGDSPIRVNGTMVGIGTDPSSTLHVNGTMEVEDTATLHGDLYSTNVQSEGALTLASGSVNRVHLDSAGNVGIGTMSPGSLLDVDGTAQVTGLRMPTGASDGHVLVSDASGNASWQAGAGLALPYEGSFSDSINPAFKVGNPISEGIAGNFEGGMFGVLGEAYVPHPTADLCAGVRGYADIVEAGTAIGVDGYAGNWHGGDAYGVRARAFGGNTYPTFGVYGRAEYSDDARGIYGSAHTGSGDGTAIGVYGTAVGVLNSTLYAGYFEGDVHVNGTLSKSAGSFKIDHPLDPENMYLSHSFVESPDMMNVYNGNVLLDGRGEARVELPEYFEALNRNFRYQLTPIGGAAPNLHVAERISDGCFAIAGGEPGLEVSWQVTGIRRDRFAEEHPIIVEEAKRDVDRGKYLNPELYGRSASDGIHYAEPRDSDSQ